MTGHDKVVLALTFLMGLISGMYFYTMDFRPTYLPERQDNIEEANAFSVVGRAYGGHTLDAYVHPSFRISEDGTFEYFEGGIEGEQTEPIEGELPRPLLRELMDTIEASDLQSYSLSTRKEFCNIYVDGFDYIYRVTIQGAQYDLDTCATAIPYESDVAKVLLDVWAYLETGEYESSDSADGDTPANFAEEWLRKQFDWREEPDDPVACTMEAKICPDGSSVGRTGPNCEFAACPGE